MKNSKTILTKLVVNGFITVIISFLIAGSILFGMAINSTQISIEEKRNMLNANAERISKYSLEVFSNTWSPLAKNYKTTIDIIAQSIDANIIVFDTNAQIVAVAGLDENKYMGNVLSGEYITKILQGVSISEVSVIDIYGDKNMITVGKPIADSITYGGVLLSANSIDISGIFSRVLKQFGMAALISLIIAFILFYYISKRITEPIKSISNAVVEFSRGNFENRIHCDTNNELELLSQNINVMADSIEKSEKLRTDFISNVSHELRTPMTSITGFVKGILDGTIPHEKENEYLNIVYAESKRLSKLTDDLLKISRLKSDKIVINKRIFNINELARICVLKFENDIENKKIDINIDFENDNTDVFGDWDAFTQIMTNILHNAVKFTPENGNITIKTYGKNEKIYVEIKNSGEGINEEKINNIWNKFYKADSSRANNPDGVGLGLYIVKSLINKNKEQIWVNSVENEYAMFTFTISKP